MKVVFFGSGEFGLPSLKRLAAVHEVLAVVTQPDRPAGRSRVPTPTPIGLWAAEQSKDRVLLKPENVNDPAVVSQIRGLGADAWVVIAFGQKLSKGLLDGVFAVNLHASLLPRWRGAAPINHAVLAGDKETGNSVITLADRMDAGLILAQSRREIYPLATAGDMHDLLSIDGPELLLGVLKDHESGTLKSREQDPMLVTPAGKLSRADSWVDFSQNAEACRRRIHGLTPWPGITARLGGMELKLLRAQTESDGGSGLRRHDGAAPGTLIDGESGLIACGEQTVLRLMEVQPASKKSMSWHAFTLGHTELSHTGALVTCAKPS